MPSSSNPPGVHLASTRDEFTNYFFPMTSNRYLDHFYNPVYVYNHDADAVADRILQGASKILGVQPIHGPSFQQAEIDRAYKRLRPYNTFSSYMESPMIDQREYYDGFESYTSTMPEVATTTHDSRPLRNHRVVRRSAVAVPSATGVDHELAKGDSDVKPRRRRGPKDAETPGNTSGSTSTVNAAKKEPLVAATKDANHAGGRRRGNRNNTSGEFIGHAGEEFADSDFSGLNFNEPATTVVSELPNGHGVTIVGTRLSTGEITTRMKYDRHLMLALSHSPFSLAHPDGYPKVVAEMEEIVPSFPRRYIPREFSPTVSSTNVVKTE